MIKQFAWFIRHSFQNALFLYSDFTINTILCYAMIWGFNDMLWNFNAMLWDLHAMLWEIEMNDFNDMVRYAWYAMRFEQNSIHTQNTSTHFAVKWQEAKVYH